MSAPLTYSVAGNFDLGNRSPNQFYTGESDIVTGPVTYAAGFIFDRYQVLARNAAGACVPLDPTQTDGRQLAFAIAAEYINTTAAAGATQSGITVPVMAGAIDTQAEGFLGGVFNPDLLVWPASLATTVSRVRQFDRTNIRLQRPL